MRDALAAMTSAGIDRRRFSAADLKFHIAIAAASGNPLFRSFTAVVETGLAAYLGLSTPVDAAIMARSVSQHALIADAIADGDADKAAQSMQDVIDVGLGRVEKR